MNTKLIAILAIVFAAVVFTTVESVSSHLRVPQNKVKKELNTLENVDKILENELKVVSNIEHQRHHRFKAVPDGTDTSDADGNDGKPAKKRGSGMFARAKERALKMKKIAMEKANQTASK